MTLHDIDSKNRYLLYALSGSHAYGLNTPASDTDYRGVFYLTNNELFSLFNIDQVNDTKNDIVVYELKRFFQLVSTNNPNILELISLPEDCIVKRNSVMDLIKPEDVLSKICQKSFLQYGMDQIKKAYGLNKKVLNPMQKEKKTPLDFCYFIENNGTILLKDYLEKNNLNQIFCGLVSIPNARDIYALYYDFRADKIFNPSHNKIYRSISKSLYTIMGLKLGHSYKGVISPNEDSNDLRLSSIPKAESTNILGYVTYNKDGYTTYCKKYKEYWDWFENKNDARYEKTIEHGKNYDSKNMMHTFRLLNMAEKIAKDCKIVVRQSEEEIKWLRRVRNGEFTYDYLIKIAEERFSDINTLYDKSSLPDTPNVEKLNEILIEMRHVLEKA